ncbi:hypothetical protein A2311_01055 [candidate division WOR-1 bacterium RIFOXYB2_FULL_48_7]|uniref:Uncharacterized protein n=1 Tax=candidate division WOR-1 bacterium RIFOXYB2_FULL_48_7 TaxID=1802583 RepID=A0A1F4TNF8_UNCSA|nr:MAG: hypothetical protein A2311_01055 [candidate division WOR-1 bacterium RIFOXYB2_FULL_48_7]
MAEYENYIGQIKKFHPSADYPAMLAKMFQTKQPGWLDFTAKACVGGIVIALISFALFVNFGPFLVNNEETLFGYVYSQQELIDGDVINYIYSE